MSDHNPVESDHADIDRELAELEADEQLAQLEADERKYQEREHPGMLDSAIRGAAKGMTYGFADELAGRAMAAKQYVMGEDSGLPWDTLVNTNVEAVRRADERSRRENPVTFTGANVVGSVLSPATKAMAGGSVAGLGAAGNAAVTGAQMGALSGLGESTHRADEEGLKLAEDAGWGALLGGATGGAFGAAGQATRPETLRGLAQTAARAKESVKPGFKMTDFALPIAGAAMHGGSALKAAIIAGTGSLASRMVRNKGPGLAQGALTKAANLSEKLRGIAKPVAEGVQENATPGVFSLQALESAAASQPVAAPVGQQVRGALTGQGAVQGVAQQMQMPTAGDLRRAQMMDREFARIEKEGAEMRRKDALKERMRRQAQALQEQGIPIRLDTEESP